MVNASMSLTVVSWTRTRRATQLLLTARHLIWTSMDTRLDRLLQQLQIPEEYSYFDKLYDNEVISRLDEWKQKVDKCLTELRHLIVRESAQVQLSAQDQAKIVAVTAPFSFKDEDPWISPLSNDLSNGKFVILSSQTFLELSNQRS